MDSKENYEAIPMLSLPASEPNLQNLTDGKPWFRRHRTYLLLHLLFACTYTLLTILLLHTSKPHEPATSLTPLPSLQFHYSPQPYSDFETSIFAGLPSAQLDSAWHTLLENITLRVSARELEARGQTSVRLPGGGYMAWLGVSHELHCIKMLRQWNYRSYYHPNLTEEESVHWDVHADHCLELLRSAAICHADTTLTTFRWDQGKEKPMLNTKLIPHKCVDWDVLMESVRERVVGREEVGGMRNPLLH